MYSYKATEYVACPNFQPTGLVEYYLARSKFEAVEELLHTRQLSNGNSKIGPSGYVVYSGGSFWVMTTDF